MPIPRPEAFGVPYDSELIVALAPLFDAVSRNGAGHTLKSAVFGMHLGQAMQLSEAELQALFLALLLKDAGAASARAQLYHAYGQIDEEAARLVLHANLLQPKEAAGLTKRVLAGRSSITKKLRNVADLMLAKRKYPVAVARVNTELAASIAKDLRATHETVAGLLGQFERWDGCGLPNGAPRDAIPMTARLVAVASEVAHLLETRCASETITSLKSDSGSRFDPLLVDLAVALLEDEALLDVLEGDGLHRAVLTLEPRSRRKHVTVASADRLLRNVGRMIDSLSSWRAGHSVRVSKIAAGIAQYLEEPYVLDSVMQKRLERAALLHDINFLTTDLEIADQSRRLTAEEFASLRPDPELGTQVIGKVLDLADAALMTETAAIEAFRDGCEGRRGYMTQVEAAELNNVIVHVADQFEALTSPRPHRAARTAEQALAVLEESLTKPTGGAYAADLVRMRIVLEALTCFVRTAAAAKLLGGRHFDKRNPVVVS